MATIAIQQRMAAGTQGAGHEYLQKVRGLFGTVADVMRPYFGPTSLDGLYDSRVVLKDRTFEVAIPLDILCASRLL